MQGEGGQPLCLVCRSLMSSWVVVTMFHTAPVLLYWILLPVWTVFSADSSFRLGPLRSSTCKAIPSTLTLCHNVGYKEMHLPNLLGHGTMREAQQQSGPWVSLVSKQCHRDTKRFLCSLFAPVCLPELTEPVWPCRRFCEAVRDGCTPVMSAFGFPWPDMLHCSLFPNNTHLCIPASGMEHPKPEGRHDIAEAAVCDACSLGDKGQKEIRLGYCKSHFAFSFKLAETSVEGEDRKVVSSRRIKVLLSPSAATPHGEAVAQDSLWLPRARSCTCEELDPPFTGILVGLGSLEGGRPVVTRLMKWTKAEREMKKFLRSLQRVKCSD
ncbi:secreted frizzled-related protein 2-like [Arapaima gigas]